MSGPTILFVTDAGPEVGGGHVMRCLTLAQALRQRGATAVFLAPPAVARVLDAFADAAIGRAPAPSTEPQALVAAARDAAFDAVVFDHYGLVGQDQRSIAGARAALAIDDLADRPLHAGLVVDLGPERRAEDFEGLVPAAAKLLLGPAYAFVRPAFAEARSASLARRAAGGVGRVQVSLGLTDVGGITARVVNRILPRLGEAGLDVVLGSGAPSLATMQALAARDRRVSVHVEARDMAALTAAADLAVGAGGSSTWERCVLGVPTVMLILADNQVPASQAVARLGAAELIDARADDFEAAFDRAFTGLMRSPDRRARMSAAAAKLCDGLGADRVAEAFLSVIVAL